MKIFIDDGKFIKCGLARASGLRVSFHEACDISFREGVPKNAEWLWKVGYVKKDPDPTRRARYTIYIFGRGYVTGISRRLKLDL